jgi:hypothetical protein
MSARRQAFACSLNGLAQTSLSVLSVRRRDLKERGEQWYNIKRWKRKYNPIIVVHVILFKHRLNVNVNKVRRIPCANPRKLSSAVPYLRATKLTAELQLALSDGAKWQFE